MNVIFIFTLLLFLVYWPFHFALRKCTPFPRIARSYALYEEEGERNFEKKLIVCSYHGKSNSGQFYNIITSHA